MGGIYAIESIIFEQNEFHEYKNSYNISMK